MTLSQQPVHQIYLSCLILVLSSCGGGGSSGNSAQDNSDYSNNTIAQLVSYQNEKVSTYFSSIYEYLAHSETVIVQLEAIDTSDIKKAESGLDQLMSDLEVNRSKANTFFKVGDDIQRIERALQDKVSGSEDNSQSSLQSELVPRDVVTIMAGVCAVAGIISFVTSLQQDVEDQEAAIKRASANFERRMAPHREKYIAGEISEAAYKNIIENELARFGDDFDQATSDYLWNTVYHTSTSIISNLGPAAIRSETGLAILVKGDLETASLLNDVHSIFLFATRPVSSSEGFKDGRHADYESIFMKTSDTEEVELPAGDWNIVAFAPGISRFGTNSDDHITIREAEQTEITVYASSADSANVGGFESCSAPGKCELNYYIESPYNGQVTLSGDPDFPTIRWSRSDGRPAHELFIEASYSGYIYHLTGDIPAEVQYGQYDYPGTSAGEFCYFTGNDCTDVIPLTEEPYAEDGYELWVSSTDTENFDPYLRARFQIYGEKCP